MKYFFVMLIGLFLMSSGYQVAAETTVPDAVKLEQSNLDVGIVETTSNYDVVVYETNLAADIVFSADASINPLPTTTAEPNLLKHQCRHVDLDNSDGEHSSCICPELTVQRE